MEEKLHSRSAAARRQARRARRRARSVALLAGAVSVNLLAAGHARAATDTFSNPDTIIIPPLGKAQPYPSTIHVSGMTGTISKVTVTLTNLRHDHLNDVDALLVGPGGQAVMLLSDAGGSRSDPIRLTFDDGATTTFSANSPGNGSYRPTDHGSRGDSLPAPAPPGPYASPPQLSVFKGTDPNGPWSLFVRDDVTGDRGRIGGGWSLTIDTVISPSISVPAGITQHTDPGQCGAVVQFDVTATGDPVPSVTAAPASGSFFSVGTTTVDARAENAAGTASASFTVTVDDEEPPVLSVPSSLVADATTSAGAAVDYDVTASDNCPGVSAVATPPSGTTFPIGDSSVAVKATDAAGNTATSSFTVHVKGATEQLKELAAGLNGMGPGNSLGAHVAAALRSLDQGDVPSACGQIRGLAAEVRAQRGKSLTPDQADGVLADAARIGAVLSCK